MVCATCVALAPCALILEYFGLDAKYIYFVIGALSISLAIWTSSWLVKHKIRKRRGTEKNPDGSLVKSFKQAQQELETERKLLYIPFQDLVLSVIFLAFSLIMLCELGL